jgi:cytoskeleton protein RodZ
MASDDDKKTADDSRFRELSPGKLLVWARERAGLTQEQVAKELYMTITKVRSLEADDYRYMGSDTFTRGYIRAYATLVKLDVAQVLSAYDRHAQKHGLVEEVVPHRVESPNKPIWQFIVLLLLVLLVLWLISVWFFNNRQKDSYNKAAPIIPPVETVMSVPVLQSSSSSSSLASENSSFSSATLAAATAPESGIVAQAVSSSPSGDAISSAESSAKAEVSGVAPQSNSGQLDVISFVFTEECWLEVSDATGDALIADLEAAGSQLKLQGVAPFEVKLGNAPGVKIELNGDKVDVVPALGTNVLSLKVGKPKSE